MYIFSIFKYKNTIVMINSHLIILLKTQILVIMVKYYDNLKKINLKKLFEIEVLLLLLFYCYYSYYIL
jgi:hypothetical protein